MPDYFYEIKGQIPRAPLLEDHDQNSEDEGQPLYPSYGRGFFDSPWAFPPLFSGMVTANDKKHAKALIEDQYERTFPLRVLKADLERHPFLLRIQEFDEADEHICKRFRKMPCKECEATFRVIDHHNDLHMKYKGYDYCSDGCAEIAKRKQVTLYDLAYEGKLPAVIYQIRQRSTGKSYVGQTTKAFTYRWWQHLTRPTGCKFHTALNDADLTDWDFSVLEVIEMPDQSSERLAYLQARERHWIETVNAHSEGFNTILPGGVKTQNLELDL